MEYIYAFGAFTLGYGVGLGKGSREKANWKPYFFIGLFIIGGLSLYEKYIIG